MLQNEEYMMYKDHKEYDEEFINNSCPRGAKHTDSLKTSTATVGVYEDARR